MMVVTDRAHHAARASERSGGVSLVARIDANLAGKIEPQSRTAEILASEQMRDRIADMLHFEGVKRDRRSPEQVRAGFNPPSRCGLLYAMEREVRRLPGRLAQEASDEAA